MLLRAALGCNADSDVLQVISTSIEHMRASGRGGNEHWGNIGWKVLEKSSGHRTGDFVGHGTWDVCQDNGGMKQKSDSDVD